MEFKNFLRLLLFISMFGAVYFSSLVACVYFQSPVGLAVAPIVCWISIKVADPILKVIEK